MKSLLIIWLGAVLVGVGSLSWISAQIPSMERVSYQTNNAPLKAFVWRGEPQVQPQSVLSEDLQPALGYQALNWRLVETKENN